MRSFPCYVTIEEVNQQNINILNYIHIKRETLLYVLCNYFKTLSGTLSIIYTSRKAPIELHRVCFSWGFPIFSRTLILKNTKGQRLLVNLNKTQKYKGSLPEVLCKNDVLKNDARLTGKHLCPSLFFSKVAGL